MAKRQRPAEGSPDAAVEAANGHAHGLRPHKNGRAAGSHSGTSAKQPEAAARALQAADIWAPGISSATSFAQLQLQELLREIRSEDAAGVVQATVEQLSETLMGLPRRKLAPSKIKAFAAATGFEKEAKPLPFAPPAAVSIVGSHATGTAIHGNSIVDIAVEMPVSCFEHKDHLNHRYHAKRAMYLVALSQQLLKQPAFADQQWGVLNDDARKPTLLVNSGKADRAVPTLRLLPTSDHRMLQLRKLAPDANAVRSISGQGAALASEGAAPPQADHTGDATPHYNTSILQDALLPRHAKLLQTAISELPRLADAVALLRSWARRHGFSAAPDGVTGFHLAMLAVHLHQQGGLPAAMAAPQLMRSVLAKLAEPRTFDRGVFMARDNGTELPPPPAASVFRQRFEVVFVDPSGWLNITAGVTRSALQHAQRAASCTVKLLDSLSSSDDAFDAAFLANCASPAIAFDCMVRVSLPSAGDAALSIADLPIWRSQEAEVECIAKRALGTRAVLVRALQRPLTPARPAKGVAYAASDEVLLGVQLDPAAASRPVDMGPAAEDTAAAADFRAFWGDKAELRRFPDGSIAEAVVWEVPPGERHLIVDELLAYALRRHLPMGTLVQTYGAMLDGALTPADGDLSEAVAATRQLEAATDKLGKQLRGLSELALRIVSVQPLSAASRRTAPFPPLPHPLAQAGSGAAAAAGSAVPRCLHPIELLVHLEGSGRWPAEEAAFRKTKAALGCQLAEALASSFGAAASASEDCIDVLSDGFAFRLFLWSTRDEAMARSTAASQPVPHAAPTLPQRAAHHGLVAAVAAEAPAFAATAALAVRWAAAHMFSGVLLPEALELLAVAAFTGPSSLPQPATRMAGFLRVLALLAGHPWSVRPLLVDPASELAAADRHAVMQAFDGATAAGTAPAMWLAAPYSRESGAPWVRPALTRAAVQRLVACARRSLEALQECIAGGDSEVDPEEAGLTVFRTPLAAFDALLVLRPEALPQAAQSLLPDVAAAAPKAASMLPEAERAAAPPREARAVLSTIPAEVVRERGAKRLRRELLVGFDPVPLYVALLEEHFGHLAAFFYDGCGGRAVGIRWHTATSLPTTFSPATAHTAKPADSSNVEAPALLQPGATSRKQQTAGRKRLAVVADLPAALAQMHALGAGLVQDVLLCNGPQT